LYSGSPGFKFWSGDWLSWALSWFSSVPPCKFWHSTLN
jgi:hypothetical protein